MTRLALTLTKASSFDAFSLGAIIHSTNDNEQQCTLCRRLVIQRLRG